MQIYRLSQPEAARHVHAFLSIQAAKESKTFKERPAPEKHEYPFGDLAEGYLDNTSICGNWLLDGAIAGLSYVTT